MVSDKNYTKAFDIVTEAFRQMTLEAINEQEAAGAIVDFTAAAIMVAGGEDGIEPIIERIRTRAEEFRRGEIPRVDGAAS